jgi:hypothetical protein
MWQKGVAMYTFRISVTSHPRPFNLLCCTVAWAISHGNVEVRGIEKGKEHENKGSDI